MNKGQTGQSLKLSDYGAIEKSLKDDPIGLCVMALEELKNVNIQNDAETIKQRVVNLRRYVRIAQAKLGVNLNFPGDFSELDASSRRDSIANFVIQLSRISPSIVYERLTPSRWKEFTYSLGEAQDNLEYWIFRTMGKFARITGRLRRKRNRS